MKYEYHHMGIPTTEKRPGEQYNEQFKYWSSGYVNSEFRVQWHRFEPDCPLHPLIKTVPHVAFKVDDLEEAIRGKKLLLEPYYPLEGFRVAIIEDGGAPIEFIETDLTEDEINERAGHKAE
jgi:hypothetical protein